MSKIVSLLEDKAKQVHARSIGKVAIYLFLLLLVGIGFNLLGGGWLIVNQTIGVVAVLGVVVFSTRLKELLLGIPLVAMFNGDVSEEEKKAGKKPQSYFDLVGLALLVISLTFLFLGTWSAKENPGAIPAILLSLIVLGLMLWKWGGETKIGKRFAHAYAFGVLLISMASIFPGALWIKFTGHDPRILFVSSNKDQAVFEADKALVDSAEEKDVERLKKITKNVKDGFRISADDELFLEKARKERDARTLPALSGKLISSAAEFVQRDGMTSKASLPQKEEVKVERWETAVDWTKYCPDQPRKKFATLPSGEYRWVVEGEYRLYVNSSGRKFYRRVRPDGSILNDESMEWRVYFSNPASPPLPVREAPIASFIYNLGSSMPRSEKTFTVREETVVNVGINLWEDYADTVGETPQGNFSENQGELSVKIERKVTS